MSILIRGRKHSKSTVTQEGIQGSLSLLCALVRLIASCLAVSRRQSLCGGFACRMSARDKSVRARLGMCSAQSFSFDFDLRLVKC